MSLLTRCPACTTLYRVVPDQLRISQGWVKCGQCGEIFDASQHLIEAYTEPETLSPDVHRPTTEPAFADALIDVRTEPTLDELAPPVAAPDVELAPDISLPADLEPIADATPNGGLNSREGASSVSLDALATRSAQHIEVADWQAGRPEIDPPPPSGHDLDQVSFLNESRRQLFWDQPLVRAVLLCASVALCLGLLAQWVYQDRDHLAAAKPEMKPWLEKFCTAVNCSVRPLRRIDALVVDTAAFNKLGPDAYRLSFTVKNQGNLAVALPSVEVTLSDLQDQVVIRRVFEPLDLSATANILAAGGEWPVSVAVRLKSDAATPRVVGYRVIAFYP